MRKGKRRVLFSVSIVAVVTVAALAFIEAGSVQIIFAHKKLVEKTEIEEKRTVATSTPTLLSTSTSTPTPTPSPAPPPMGADAFMTRVFTDSQGLSLKYYLYVPYNYTPMQRYPLVLLLHGGGERSNPAWPEAEQKAVLFVQSYAQVWTPGYSLPYSPRIQQRWPCFVVIPQLSYGQYWVDTPVGYGSYTQPAQPTPWLLMAKEILDALQKEYREIDPGRLYITGLSLGGYGVWDAIERWPNYFAAAIPIAGAGDPSKAAVLKNLPIWAFQGADDTVVPPSSSSDMVAAIEAAGGHPRYTEYTGAGHTIWDYVYGTSGTSQNTPGVLPWLFSQKKVEPVYVPPHYAGP
ncbi:MAG TPA: prolyl oligopeptidase family serine peptidase [Ktedonobacteraceae bacterium]|nr:prolyl oligopeptidase family serine peptidase [Ktedonobacteraceae bacterium]